MFKTVDLYTKSLVYETVREETAVEQGLGNGRVVVDTTGNRVYDGGYERWFPLQVYLQHFPRLEWLSRYCDCTRWTLVSPMCHMKERRDGMSFDFCWPTRN